MKFFLVGFTFQACENVLLENDLGKPRMGQHQDFCCLLEHLRRVTQLTSPTPPSSREKNMLQRHFMRQAPCLDSSIEFIFIDPLEAPKTSTERCSAFPLPQFIFPSGPWCSMCSILHACRRPLCRSFQCSFSFLLGYSCATRDKDRAKTQ